MRAGMRRAGLGMLTAVLPLLGAVAQSRFPAPQFDTDHQVPQSVHPPFAELVVPWLDVAIFVGAMGLSVWLVHRLRSRRWILVLTVVSLVWFGFVRRGCICPVGSVQNVAQAVAGGGGLAWPVAVFFALPLLTALLYGRVFCAAICPLGAMQEVVIINPLRVPRVVDAVLRLVPPLVLAVGVVLAINGAGYWICQTDPFVGLFRRSAPLSMLVAGLAVVLLGMVVARPYCRYFCPYSVLLEFCSRFAWRRVEITELGCINCRLCVGVCPVGAVSVPRDQPSESARARQFRRFVRTLLLVPLLLAGGWGAGWMAGGAVAGAHRDVVVVKLLAAEDEGRAEGDEPELQAFYQAGLSREEAEEAALVVVDRFRAGGRWAGLFVGLVIALRLLGFNRLSALSLHEADRARCVACGRCYPACPKNRVV